jgi:hypothetical protein
VEEAGKRKGAGCLEWRLIQDPRCLRLLENRGSRTRLHSSHTAPGRATRDRDMVAFANNGLCFLNVSLFGFYTS